MQGPRRKPRNEQFDNDYKSVLSGVIKRAILIGTSDNYADDYLIKNMISELRKDFKGIFNEQDAEDGNTDIDLAGDILFIRNFDQMNAGIKNRLMILANSNKNKDKIIILQCDTPINIIDDKLFKQILLPSEEQISSKFPEILVSIIKNKFLILSPQRKLSEEEIQYLHKSAVIKIFKKIHPLLLVEKEIKELIYKRTFPTFDFSDPDFWWEFKNHIDINYPATKIYKPGEKSLQETIEENVLTNEQEQTEDENMPTVKFNHQSGGAYWEITCTRFDEKDKIESPFYEKYNELLPLKYLAYLAKYYKNTTRRIDNKIGYKDLYNIVADWHGSSRQSSSPSKNAIYNQVHTYFSENSDRNDDGSKDEKYDAEKNRIKIFRKTLGKYLLKRFRLRGECYCNSGKSIKIEVFDPDMERHKPKTNPS